jgi:hypothetical protein
MDINDALGGVFLGSGFKNKTYSPQEQAQWSAKFPGLVWVNGKPFTQGSGNGPAIDPNDPYAYQSSGDQNLAALSQQGQGGLQPADLSDPNFVRQLAQFAGSTSVARGAISTVDPASQALYGGSNGSAAGYLPSEATSLSAPVGTAAQGAGTLGSLTPQASLAAPDFFGSAAFDGMAGGAGAAAPSAAVGSSAIPGGYAASAPSAAAPVAGWQAPAAGGIEKWAPRILAAAQLGAPIAEGIIGHNAINAANKASQQATNQALQINAQAHRTAGDVYNQQRADTQNLFGQGYQTLGGLLGMNIAPIGPMAGIQTSANPSGAGTGLHSGSPQTPGSYGPLIPSDLTPAAPGAQLAKQVGIPASSLTLAQLQALATANSKRTASSYGRRA